ncbi:MAG: CoA-binding protein [Candidatus Thorarchaeota archaeon]
MASKTAKTTIGTLFSANSIVLIGASDNPRALGFQVARSLIRDFKGKVYYVNPTEAMVFGYSTFATLDEVPRGSHLWIITTLTKDFPQTLQVIDKRRPIAILLLIEIQPNLQNELRKVIPKLSCPVIGPRSAGIFDTTTRLDLLPFSPEVLPRPSRGATGVITDNRDVAFGLLEQLTKYRCGVSRVIDLGETLGTDESDLLTYLIQDEETKVILLGAGQVAKLSKFRKAIRKGYQEKKPIIVSLFAKKITQQMGLHRREGKSIVPLTRELASKCNLMITPSWGRAVDLALLCQNQPLPKGPGVVAISNFGAYCVYVASALYESTLHLAKLLPRTINSLKDNLPPYCRSENPIGLYTNADEVRFDTALRLILDDSHVHSIIISLLPNSPNIDPDYLYVMLRQRLKSFKTQKTILGVIPTTERDNLLIQTLEQLRIPVFSNSHRAVTTLENAYHLAKLLKVKT